MVNADFPQDPEPARQHRRRVVVVGFGMVGVAFVEKLLNYDSKENGGNSYVVTIIGDEPCVAYNRVGLTQYFSHRKIENLYLNSEEWYSSHVSGRLVYQTDSLVEQINSEERKIHTNKGLQISYDICVLATGSHAALPPYVSPSRAQSTGGVFVYRTVADLDRMIAFADGKAVRRAAVIGGGLLGLEAAKALLDLGTVPQVTLVERNEWVLSRQLDGEAGRMVLEQVRALNVEVLLSTRVKDLVTEPAEHTEVIKGLRLEGDETYECDMVVFAVGIKPRDELAAVSGIATGARGGFLVKDDLSTSVPNIYAIGECASWNGETYGLIAPGIEMADILAFNFTEGLTHKMRSMAPPDLSTKLKLLGVNVASFGDYFADRKPADAVTRPGRRGKGSTALAAAPELTDSQFAVNGQVSTTTAAPVSNGVRSLVYHDPFSYVYKKYLFTADGKYLLGGMMIGDVTDYTKLVSMVKKRKPLEIPPGQLILGVPRKEGESDGDDLDEDAQICSCHNVPKSAITSCVAAGCTSFGELKAKTKIGTGCGGCVPLATSIFNSLMKKAGHSVTNYLCAHFKKSRRELFLIAKVKKLTSFKEIMADVGENPGSLGCEVCKPAIASILASLHNEFVMSAKHHQNQDTNDKYLANIQRNGSYSVVPRISGGEITPAKLKVIAAVGEKYGLYAKITGGQRIDLFGAAKKDLPDIWEELGNAGFESGHAYGKALRTVKSCVGTTWCRYGIGDSVGFAIELENRYKGIRAPHKFKGGVSGCVRECAEAQAKDFGVIATSKGWNVYVGGNGGAKPRHAELLAADVSRKKAVKLIDRFLMLYIESADRLQRTARWIESFAENGQNGLEYLKKVIIDDSLGICKDLDQAMDALVGTYFDEWAEVVRNPEKRALFRQFANTDEQRPSMELIKERDQSRPVDWPAEALPLKIKRSDVQGGLWQWHSVAKLKDLNPSSEGSSSIVVNYSDTQIAIFRLANGNLYATQQGCPHRRAFVLADGLIGDTADGKPYVSCPLHKRNFKLENGECLNDDEYGIVSFEVKEENGEIFLKLPEPILLDEVLGTAKWMIRKATEEVESFGSKHVEIVGPTAAPHLDAVQGNGCGSQTCASGSALEW
ncbi:putative BFD-like [2Fe-2S] binding domain containing protein [Lyophyllum shimeji]|uniref:BFD-like [2Fe-2S] binding domain containing protein n=1 Tax=Lyophyllum shimeji TaxID=47721 RepID=A0A9P3PDM4_LYOSH|nr:putative BFD-like [2Fe-2S] binding domain containing protein [Lyophyllum shimeji]